MKRRARRRGSTWRIAVWAIIVALVLMLPLSAMHVTDDVDWSAFDFAFAGALLIAAGVACELALRVTDNWAYRVGAGVAVASILILVWVNGAVGIIGTEDDDANLMYGGVLAVLVIGAVIARFRPDGMARALFAAALAQALVGVIALAGGLGSSNDPEWPRDILGLTAFFVALWLASAWLFQKAAARPLASA